MWLLEQGKVLMPTFSGVRKGVPLSSDKMIMRSAIVKTMTGELVWV